MKALKSARTLAASLGVLVVGAMAASPAMAFNNVNWSWNNHTNEWVDISACINLHVDITGMVQVEKLQIFLGDAKATSTVHDIYNNPIRQTAPSAPTPPPPKPPKGGMGGGYGDFNIAGKQGGGYEGGDRGPKMKPVYLALDARYELPIVLSSATAVGNNQSITSDVPVFLHDGQFVANVKDQRYGGIWSNPDAMLASVPAGGSFDSNGRYNNSSGGNLNTVVALLFGIGAVTHELSKADISAKSHVYDVRNVSVDSSAQAVANNISVTVASNNPSNHLVIADITQFALANVTADSTVDHVSADGYSHMRELTTATLQTIGDQVNQPVAVPTPWISSVATAVGNNATISVGNVLHK